MSDKQGSIDHKKLWLEVGVDIASRIWNGWEALTADELRALGKEQWTNPVPGHNDLIRPMEAKYPELRRKP
ncbi:hypothetical protein [uncultured Microbacterium sp.]|uniref:hypothetical protein n=1 Tax=uncultured Microbacterium sp. TaxID=191216 RepID=UPI0028D38091|nr:hypothetical protein [uncultured Microbacterium sp.]